MEELPQCSQTSKLLLFLYLKLNLCTKSYHNVIKFIAYNTNIIDQFSLLSPVHIYIYKFLIDELKEKNYIFIL